MEGKERPGINPAEIPEVASTETKPFENTQLNQQEPVVRPESPGVQQVPEPLMEPVKSPETVKPPSEANLEVPTVDTAPNQAELNIESIMQHSLEGFTDG